MLIKRDLEYSTHTLIDTPLIGTYCDIFVAKFSKKIRIKTLLKPNIRPN